MNIHPIFVHFPIALMTIYAVLELIRHKRVINTLYFFYIKATLVILGTLTALLSLSTGEIAEDLLTKNYKPLIDMHANFASFSTNIFGIIAILYLISWINRSEFNQKISDSFIGKYWTMSVNFSNYILSKSYIIIPLSIIGLISITITGSLGGAIVYGPEVDPIVSFIYHLFF